MRLLERNKQTIYYRNYEGMTPIMDGSLETGEYEKTYGSINIIRAYVKSAVGTNAAEPFGDFTSKQRTIYIEGATEINEYSQIWVGIDPTLVNGKPTVPHNFDVIGVAHGLNHSRVSIRKVEKSLGIDTPTPTPSI